LTQELINETIKLTETVSKNVSSHKTVSIL